MAEQEPVDPKDRLCVGCEQEQDDHGIAAMEIILHAELENLDTDGAVTVARGGLSIGRWHALCLRHALKAAHRLHGSIAHLEAAGAHPVLVGTERHTEGVHQVTAGLGTKPWP